MAGLGVVVDRARGGGFRPLSREAIELALIVSLLPNLLFLAAMPFFIAERLLSPLLYLAAGLFALVVPRWVAILLFLAAALIDLGLIVMVAFHLTLPTAIDSIRYLAAIDIGASAFYMAFGGAMLATTMLAAMLVTRARGRLRTASPLAATLLALALMLLDYRFNYPYIDTKTADVPFESAVAKSGLTAGAVAARGNNLLIVMVEGLGAFADPEDRAVLGDKLRAVTRSAPYRLVTGTSHYSGSTTGGESRELCGRWGDHRDYLAGDHDCLPRQLARRGYETIAYHGFSAAMFDRDRWYPRIGFTRMHFEAQLARDHGDLLTRRCGSVFEGLCDDQLGAVVARELTTRSERPKLVYWLTLNSHIPFVAERDVQLGCAGDRPRIDNATVCALTEYWADVIDQVAVIATDPDLPPTDILIVGDHHTPFWERAAKDRFVLGEVDWFLLRYRGNASATTFGGQTSVLP